MHARDAYGAAAPYGREAAAARLTALAERLGRTAAVARALVLAGRTVELAGFEDGVGMLCASAMDTPREEARGALPALHALLAEIASLTEALRRTGT
jgi:hypothetical protein